MTDRKIKILWADDEIDLLKPHILLLEKKGYDVTSALSGDEAIAEVEKQNFDVIFLDENMPGLTGLETLKEIKRAKAYIPVVMITKSEEEYLMDDAIGSQISDYLIKPVNPNQILLSLKKIIDSHRLISEKVNTSYQQGFAELSMRVGDRMNIDEWKQLYRDLTYWELQLSKSGEESMQEILMNQKSEANQNFSKLIESDYEEWMESAEDAPTMSHNVLNRKLIPQLKKAEGPTVLLVIDNLRYDQWKFLEAGIERLFKIVDDDVYFSILPTATQYARNALFAGLMPADIQKKFANKWLNDEDEGGKNQHEEFFLREQLKRAGLSNLKLSYNKVVRTESGKQLIDNAKNLLANNDLLVIVYNFIDMLSHARTDMEVIKELAEDEAAYRSLTLSWFEHSPLKEILQIISQQKAKLIITTDHGSIRVKKPVQVVGDRNTTTNLRYKQGKNLKYKHKEVVEFRDPHRVKLPKSNLSSSYIMSKPEDFFVYPNNQNYYVNFYRDTFQHGGVSIEEMLVPYIQLESR